MTFDHLVYLGSGSVGDVAPQGQRDGERRLPYWGGWLVYVLSDAYLGSGSVGDVAPQDRRGGEARPQTLFRESAPGICCSSCYGFFCWREP